MSVARRRPANRVDAVVLSVATLVCALACAGCAHTTLRRAFQIPSDSKVTVPVVQSACDHTFPAGTPISEVECRLPPSRPPLAWALWWPFDAWAWAEGDWRESDEMRRAHAARDPIRRITIESFDVYYWGGGVQFYLEIVIEFDRDVVSHVHVRDAGRAL